MTLSALSQETRLAIFRHLVAAGPGGRPAGRIATHLKVAPPTLSFHLKELERAGPDHPAARKPQHHLCGEIVEPMRALLSDI